MIQDRKESIEFEEIGWGNDIQAEIDDIDSQKIYLWGNRRRLLSRK